MSIDQGSMREEDWDSLLMLIRMGKCTPFIGAGSSYPYLPLVGNLAYDWSEKYHYPLKDSNDLAKVAQFMAIDRYPIFPKHVIAQEFKNSTPFMAKALSYNSVTINLMQQLIITLDSEFHSSLKQGL